MDAGSFRFGVGEFECVSVSDGALNYPPESFFSNAPLDRGGSPRAQLTDPRSSTCFPSRFLPASAGSSILQQVRRQKDPRCLHSQPARLDALNNPLVRMAGSRYTHEGYAGRPAD